MKVDDQESARRIDLLEKRRKTPVILKVRFVLGGRVLIVRKMMMVGPRSACVGDDERVALP